MSQKNDRDCDHRCHRLGSERNEALYNGNSVSLPVLKSFSLALLQEAGCGVCGIARVGASRHDAAGGCCSDAVGGLAA